MAKARPQPWTEFLAFGAEEPDRYEFVDGVLRMMTGGSAAHSVIKTDTTNVLNASLREGPCRAYDDLKVVTETAVMYPDVVVSCRPLGPDDDRIADPTVVVEVLSPTTETHDRIRKWRQYQTIASLQHFVLIARTSGASRSTRAAAVAGNLRSSSRLRTGWRCRRLTLASRLGPCTRVAVADLR